MSWRSPVHSARVLGILALSLLWLMPARPVRGQTSFTWGSVETVDTGVIGLSSAAGRSIAGLSDGTGQSWDAVFLKNGQVFHAVRTSGGWGVSEALSSSGITARDPQIARIMNVLNVVWEDSRSGHPEIWTRRFAGGVWTPEECLTCDGARSAAPSLCGDDDEGYLAYEEGDAGSAQVMARVWSGSAWGAPSQLCSNLVSVPGSPDLSGPLAVRVQPNPARESATFQLMLPAAGPVSVRVLDASGRCIRDFGAMSLPRGASVLTWDRRDGAGRRAPSGIYFLAVRSGQTAIRKHLVVLN